LTLFQEVFFYTNCSLNINTETGRLSARRPNLQNQPALEKDRYKVRRAFTADRGSGKTLIVADYGQLELRILAHMANCQSIITVFKLGGDFDSRTALGMYDHIQRAVQVPSTLQFRVQPQMLRINSNAQLKEMGWRLLLQLHDEVILEGPQETAEAAQALVVQCMRSLFGEGGGDPLRVELAVDSKYSETWYDAK